jgi:hypothetical protein
MNRHDRGARGRPWYPVIPGSPIDVRPKFFENVPQPELLETQPPPGRGSDSRAPLNEREAGWLSPVVRTAVNANDMEAHPTIRLHQIHEHRDDTTDSSRPRPYGASIDEDVNHEWRWIAATRACGGRSWMTCILSGDNEVGFTRLVASRAVVSS